MRKFAHIVNPVMVGEESDLFVAQPVTFRTMSIARQFAQDLGTLEVAFYSAHFQDDAALVPPDFIHTPLLERSVLDVGKFSVPRKLPLLHDILIRLYEAATTADYLIYTNVDISLLPNFYVSVNRLIDHGHDALTIFRRSIPGHYREIDDIPLMWAELDLPPQGRDCFVFRRGLFPAFDLGDVCLGAPHVGRLLMLNLAAHAQNFAEFTNLHLTFHIGQRMIWSSPEFGDYASHNLLALRATLESLKSRGRLPQHPVVQKVLEVMRAKGELAPDF